MTFENKTVFVAGAAGMAGTAIINYIISHYPSVKIKAMVHETLPRVESPNIEYIQGDLCRMEDCRRGSRGCDCAVMSAAYAGGAKYSTESPFEHMRENLLMNRQMLEAFHLEKVKRIVFIGSAVIYQAFEGSITEEELDFNADPHMAYFGFAWAMRFLEKLCWYMHIKFEHEVILIRAANIFGPRDKFDEKRSNFIPAIIRKASDRLDPFVLWGEPDVTRDVIFCNDFAKAIVLALASSEIKFDIFNVGSGVRTTVGQVVEWILKYNNHYPEDISWKNDMPTTIKYRALDCSKIQERLGWSCDNTIEQGIEQTVKWWDKNKNKWHR